MGLDASWALLRADAERMGDAEEGTDAQSGGSAREINAHRRSVDMASWLGPLTVHVLTTQASASAASASARITR